MRAFQKIDKHGCCTSTHSVSRIRRESLITRLRPISEEGTFVPPMAQQRQIQLEAGLEIIEEAREAAEANQLEAYERFEQDRREAHQRAGEQRPQRELLIPPPYAHQMLSCVIM
jgi:hypothetical protein